MPTTAHRSPTPPSKTSPSQTPPRPATFSRSPRQPRRGLPKASSLGRGLAAGALSVLALSALALSALALTVLAPAPAAAEQLLTAGGPSQINTTTAGNQGFPAIAVTPAGDSVIAWESFGQDGDGWGVFAQRVDAQGTPLGGELQVNSAIVGTQWDAAVAADGSGGFVVAWESDDGGADDFEVRARRFDAAGSPLAPEFAVNVTTLGDQDGVSVAALSGGEVMVAWESSDADGLGVYGRFYDAAGDPVGGELRLNDTVTNDQNDVRVAAAPGGFVAVWESLLQDGADEATILRFFDADGTPDGGEIVANTLTLGDQEDPDVAVAADGTVAVVWEDSVQDGFGEGVYARVFGPDGAPAGAEQRLNLFTTGDQKNPRVGVDGTGGFVAVWTSEGQVDGLSEDVFGRRFNAQGTPLGGEFRVNTQTAEDQDVPAIAGGPAQRFQVVWRTLAEEDGSQAGVFGQRYEIAVFADGFESGDTSAWSGSQP